MDNFNEIEKLWINFNKLQFPAKLGGEKVNGICITSLDTFTAGCIDTFISRKGHLDKPRISILEKSKNELEMVINNLKGEERTYFEKLLGSVDITI